ncbi:helix-turn-helix domain-containing protein [Paenibacillus sp. 276b]|uniref:helix-turn-helix domain-containing protein n=1 Tax=Paenibacillus sp. 276b TaxID=1566277 RepID=UPI000899B367|nr:helix-turn-helix transcriptional regulator [Paenibacillus sp. 276b]SEB20876.1 Helix-turn-helix [Paenibacillus sp. 276b]
MTKLRNSVGERIRAIRKAKGLTQQQLAELSGLDDAYVGSLERGERNFSIDTLEKIVVALNVPVQDLIMSIDNDKESMLRRNALDEYSEIINNLKTKEIVIVKNILKELRRAFD